MPKNEKRRGPRSRSRPGAEPQGLLRGLLQSGCKEAGKSYEAEELYAQRCKLVNIEPCAEVDTLRKVRERRERMKLERE